PHQCIPEPCLCGADRAALLTTFGRTAVVFLLAPARSTMLAFRLAEFRTGGAFRLPGGVAKARALLAGAALRPAIGELFAFHDRGSGQVLRHRQLLTDQALDLSQLGGFGRI